MRSPRSTATRGDWTTAVDHTSRALRLDADNLRARNLHVVALASARSLRRRRSLCLQRDTQASIRSTGGHGCCAGEPLACDNQVRLDLAHDFVRAGLLAEAASVLASAPLRFVESSRPGFPAAPRIHGRVDRAPAGRHRVAADAPRAGEGRGDGLLLPCSLGGDLHPRVRHGGRRTRRTRPALPRPSALRSPPSRGGHRAVGAGREARTRAMLVAWRCLGHRLLQRHGTIATRHDAPTIAPCARVRAMRGCCSSATSSPNASPSRRPNGCAGSSVTSRSSGSGMTSRSRCARSTT